MFPSEAEVSAWINGKTNEAAITITIADDLDYVKKLGT